MVELAQIFITCSLNTLQNVFLFIMLCARCIETLGTLEPRLLGMVRG